MKITMPAVEFEPERPRIVPSAMAVRLKSGPGGDPIVVNSRRDFIDPGFFQGPCPRRRRRDAGSLFLWRNQSNIARGTRARGPRSRR